MGRGASPKGRMPYGARRHIVLALLFVSHGRFPFLVYLSVRMALLCACVQHHRPIAALYLENDILNSTKSKLFRVDATDVIGCDTEFGPVISQSSASRLGFSGVKIDFHRSSDHFPNKKAQLQVLKTVRSTVRSIIDDLLSVSRSSHKNKPS